MRDELPIDEFDLDDDFTPEEERHLALAYVSEAFEEAEMLGVEPNCVAMVALFKSFAALVHQHGEDAIAQFASNLPERVRSGEFSTSTIKH